jgi:hypothetical protein
MQEIQDEEERDHEIQLNNLGPKVKNLVLSEPVQQAIKVVRDTLVSVSASRERIIGCRTTDSDSRSRSSKLKMNPFSEAFYPNAMITHPRVVPTPV